MDLVEGPSQGEAAFAAVRQGRGGDEPRPCEKLGRACRRLGSLHFKTDMIVSSRVEVRNLGQDPGCCTRHWGKVMGCQSNAGILSANSRRTPIARDLGEMSRAGEDDSRHARHLLQLLHQFCNRRDIIMFSCRPILIP